MFVYGGAAIAQWIRPNLPSCCPGFESQAHHLRFDQFMLVCVKKGENKQKESGIGPFFKKSFVYFKTGPTLDDFRSRSATRKVAPTGASTASPRRPKRPSLRGESSSISQETL